jgi:hypothetical protein
VGGDDGVNSMLQFRLERGGDGTKCCRKMQQRQRAHLGSMRRKHDTGRWNDDVGWRRGASWVDTNFIRSKNEENSRDIFNYYK